MCTRQTYLFFFENTRQTYFCVMVVDGPRWGPARRLHTQRMGRKDPSSYCNSPGPFTTSPSLPLGAAAGLRSHSAAAHLCHAVNRSQIPRACRPRHVPVHLLLPASPTAMRAPLESDVGISIREQTRVEDDMRERRGRSRSQPTTGTRQARKRDETRAEAKKKEA